MRLQKQICALFGTPLKWLVTNTYHYKCPSMPPISWVGPFKRAACSYGPISECFHAEVRLYCEDFPPRSSQRRCEDMCFPELQPQCQERGKKGSRRHVGMLTAFSLLMLNRFYSASPKQQLGRMEMFRPLSSHAPAKVWMIHYTMGYILHFTACRLVRRLGRDGE